MYMKKVFGILVAILICSTMAMCIGQIDVPESFKQDYQKIESTQKEIETLYLAYESQVDKRIEYVEKNKSTSDSNISNIDYKYLLSLLESETLILDELDQKSATYSSEINDLFTKTKDIKNNEVKSKANELIIILRNSQQYLTNGIVRLKSATNSTGSAIYYYASGANLNDPLVVKEIQDLNLDAKTGFDEAVLALNNYYTLTKDANATYQELLKTK